MKILFVLIAVSFLIQGCKTTDEGPSALRGGFIIDEFEDRDPEYLKVAGRAVLSGAEESDVKSELPKEAVKTANDFLEKQMMKDDPTWGPYFTAKLEAAKKIKIEKDQCIMVLTFPEEKMGESPRVSDIKKFYAGKVVEFGPMFADECPEGGKLFHEAKVRAFLFTKVDNQLFTPAPRGAETFYSMRIPQAYDFLEIGVLRVEELDGQPGVYRYEIVRLCTHHDFQEKCVAELNPNTGLVVNVTAYEM